MARTKTLYSTKTIVVDVNTHARLMDRKKGTMTMDQVIRDLLDAVGG